LKQTVRTKFWDEQKQLFNDGYKDGQLCGKYYPTSNAWPLLYHCTTKDQAEKLIDYLESQFRDIGEDSRNRRITPYSSFYALAALYQHERADIAERFIKQYWTRMILDGDDTAWENFDSGDGGQGTLSHAWSGHPTYFLTTEALGVNLGFHKEFNKNIIIISPQSENLSWARGVVPHPLGPVAVEWRLEGNHLFLDYSSPEGAEVFVQPKGRLANKILWVNGKRVK
jgi:alpha-L-rhamnosidase